MPSPVRIPIMLALCRWRTLPEDTTVRAAEAPAENLLGKLPQARPSPVLVKVGEKSERK
jgi:hypothetical protein